MADAPRRSSGSSSASGSCGGGSGAASVFSVVRLAAAVPRRDGPRARRPGRARAPGDVDGRRATSSSSRPACMAASAMMMAAGESLWPVMARREVDGHVPRGGVDADRVERRVRGQARVDRHAAPAWSATVFLARRRGRSAACRRRGGCSRSRPRCSVRSALAAPLCGVGGHPGERRPVRRRHAPRGVPAVPVLGHVLPGEPAARLARVARVALAAVARGRAVPGRDHRRRAGADALGAVVVHVACSLVFVAAGWWWGVRTFRRMLTQ